MRKLKSVRTKGKRKEKGREQEKFKHSFNQSHTYPLLYVWVS